MTQEQKIANILRSPKYEKSKDGWDWEGQTEEVLKQHFKKVSLRWRTLENQT